MQGYPVFLESTRDLRDPEVVGRLGTQDAHRKTLSNPVIQGWAVTKDGGDFDAFTGATVTPRAVVAAVKSAIEYSQNNRSTLFEMPEADES